MSTTSAVSTQTEDRSLAPDLARGFMLLLIACANVVWHLWGQGVDPGSQHLPATSTSERWVQAVSSVVVDMRVYPMFAFLFGYGMVQFWNSRRRRGEEPGRIRQLLRRRHWAMILFGAVHALLLFNGDILAAYGVAGLLMVWLFFERRDKTLAVWCWVFLGLMTCYAVFSLIGGWALMQAPPELLDDIAAQNEAAAMASVGGAREMVSAQENYLLAALVRIGFLPFLAIGQLFGLAIPTAILLGWLAARHRVLEDPAAHRRLLVGTAAIGITVGWLGGLPVALVKLGVWQVHEAAWWMYQGSAMVTGIAAGVGYVALFGLLSIRLRRRGLTRAVAAVGQRSLSFYLLQSIILAPLLAAWGLGLGARVGTAGAWGIAAAVWLLSVVLAAVLDRQGRRGPFEVLLRRLTQGRRAPQAALTASGKGDGIVT